MTQRETHPELPAVSAALTYLDAVVERSETSKAHPETDLVTFDRISESLPLLADVRSILSGMTDAMLDDPTATSAAIAAEFRDRFYSVVDRHIELLLKDAAA